MYKFLGILLVTIGLPGRLLLLLQAIKLIKLIAWPKEIAKMSLNSKEESFTITESGKYKIWINGPVRTLIPSNISCQIKNTGTGRIENISVIQIRLQTVDYGFGKKELFNVKLSTGNYLLQQINGEIDSAWAVVFKSIFPIERLLNRAPIEKWSFVLTKSYPKIYFPLGIIATICCAGLALGALIFGVILMQK